jgi:adenosylcobinamide kinase/adenosylcobinamide-phosphate guanylyltransferase
MGKIIMVTGGARSGKSTFAEETASGLGERVLYIATSIAFDDEMKERVRKHREKRPSGWITVESHKGFDHCLDAAGYDFDAAVLDCLTLMVSNLMLENDMEWDNVTVDEINSIETIVSEELDKLIAKAEDCPFPFIIVTNELGMGVVPPTILGRAVRDIGGRCNQRLAKAADEVYMCISGIPVRIK